MKEQKNHVGRPTNEEVSERKKKKAIKIVAVLVVVLVLVIGSLSLLNINTSRLKGEIGKDLCKKSNTTGLCNYNNGRIESFTFYAVETSKWNGDKTEYNFNIKNVGRAVDKVEVYVYPTKNFTGEYLGRKAIYTDVNGVTKKVLIPVSTAGRKRKDLYIKILTYYNKLGSAYLWEGQYKYTNITGGDGYEQVEIIKYKDSPWVEGIPPTSWESWVKEQNAKLHPQNKPANNNISNPNPSKVIFNCPGSVLKGKQFSCETNQQDVQIKIVSGCTLGSYISKGKKQKYSTSFTTTSMDKTKQTVCTNSGGKVKVQLFDKTGKVVKYKDENGNIKDSRYIEIKEKPKDGKYLTLSCPTSAKQNQKFTCKVTAGSKNQKIKDVKISVTETNLATKDYGTSFTTTSEDNTKQSKYTKKGRIVVIAYKKGYVSASTRVDIK